MLDTKKIIIITSTLFAISSTSPSSNYVHQNNAADLSWLFSMENLESDSKELQIKEKTIKPKVCNTKECHQVAEEFLAAMNKSVDPCEDFYKFSCGGWATNKPAPKYTPNWSRLKILETITNHRIKRVLETQPKKMDILPVRQAKKWYQSCMDEKSREARGLKPIESILLQIGGWPMTMDNEEWDEDEYSWQRVDEHFTRLTGEATFFQLKIAPSYDGTMGTFYVDGPELPLANILPLKYRNYAGDDYATYAVLIQKIAKLLIDHNKADVSEDRLKEDIEDMIKFEKMLYMKNSVIRKINLDHATFDVQFTLKDFIEFYNSNISLSLSNPQANIPWRSILEQILVMINHKADDSTNIGILDWQHIIHLPELLKSTQKRTIINYIHWKFVSQYIKYTNEEVRSMLFELLKDEYGVQERMPRWEECVAQMEMTDAAAYAFVNEYYSKEKDEIIRKTLNAIMNSLRFQINQSNWMDDESKVSAIEKINAMNLLVGFPDWYKNKTAVIHSYKGLAIGHEYLDNILGFVRYKKKGELKMMAGQDQREPWPLNAITVNAIYGENKIVAPAVDFQSPLFEKMVPNYVNYGTVGMFIGHEMGHAFDDSGIRTKADYSGDLLSENMLKMYYQRATCFTKQFDKYYGTQTIPPEIAQRMEESGEKTMGLMTRAENIADTTGLQAVLDAYKKFLKTNKPSGELKLSGFEEFSDEQMFFISFAQMWCDISTPEYEAKRRALDVHSPADIRVIGALSNTKDFSDVFNCPSGSPMNPENKCNIWMKPGAQPRLEKIRSKVSFGDWKNYWN